MSLVWIMYVHTFTLMNFLQICIVIKQTFPLKMLNKMQMNGIEDQLAEILFYVNFVLGEIVRSPYGQSALIFWMLFSLPYSVTKVCIQNMPSISLGAVMLLSLWQYSFYSFFFSSFIDVPYEECL